MAQLAADAEGAVQQPVVDDAAAADAGADREEHHVVVVDPGAAVGLRRLRGLVVVTITALEDLSRVRSGLAPA